MLKLIALDISLLSISTEMPTPLIIIILLLLKSISLNALISLTSFIDLARLIYFGYFS